MRKITHIVIHCSATRPDANVTAEVIRKWHKDKGWSDIGYHYVIERDGTVSPGRPLPRQGAHVAGHNATSIGVCLVGGVDGRNQPEINYTDAQVRTLVELVDELEIQFEGATVLGHRDFAGVAKACPCFDVRTWRKTGTMLASI